MKEYIVDFESDPYEPTIKNELVRCKDCKYRHQEFLSCDWHRGDYYTWYVDDDDYCSVGEREEE